MNDKQCKRIRRIWKSSPAIRSNYPNIRAYRREVQRHGTVLLVQVGNPQGRPFLAVRSALPDIDRARDRRYER